MSFSCFHCSIKLLDVEKLKEHCKSDWHRYNLKRKVSGLLPVTAEEFQKRVLLARNDHEDNSEQCLYCQCCRKQFGNQSSYDNHLKSKKHNENSRNFSNGKIEDPKEDTPLEVKQTEPTDLSDEIHDNCDIEEEEVHDEKNCIFCDEVSETIDENLIHMSTIHSFFIPDKEFCKDIQGLLSYLQNKVKNYFVCLWCNDRGKTFYSLGAVRKHMIDKGHCQMSDEGVALIEYEPYYDYSSSYPDNEEDMDIDEEIVPDLLDGDEYQLVLPSGAVIGHRSLLRYYKQRLQSNGLMVPHKARKPRTQNFKCYQTIGWTNCSQKAAAMKSRDIHTMKRVLSKYHMKLGVKANKLQHHYREQVLF